MHTCPCCSSRLLRHINDREVYWFCRHCWQAMPVLGENKYKLLPDFEIGELPRILQKPEKLNAATRKNSISLQSTIKCS